jgi:beta-lactamase regulating signal transducer with metallopeptidase domain
MMAISLFGLRVSEWIDYGFCGALLDASIKSVVVLALTWSAVRLMRNRSAAARHLVWCAATIAILIVPVLSLALPSWRTLPSPVSMGVYLAPLRAATVTISAQMAPQSINGSSPAHISLDVATLLFVCWAIGVVVLLLPMLLGQLRLWKSIPHYRPDQERELSLLVDRIRRQLCIRRSVQLWIAQKPLMPMTWGIMRPKLVLPRNAQDWPSARRHAVVLHEMGHVARFDCLTHLISQIARAIYWFNPLAWLAVRRMEAEREHACDDLVIGSGVRQTDYAREILEISAAYSLQFADSIVMPMIRGSTIEQRVRDILKNNATRGKLNMRHVLIAAVLLMTFVLPISMLRADGENPTSSQPSAGTDAKKDGAQSKQAAHAIQLVIQACFMYTIDHNSTLLPNDLGELAATINDADDKSALSVDKSILFVDPQNPVEEPKELSADWINKNSPWIYLAANTSVALNKIKHAHKTVLIHSDLEKPFGDVVVLGFVDGHVEFENVDAAKAAIEQSKQTIKNAADSDGK